MRTAVVSFTILGILLSAGPVRAQEQAPVEAPKTIEEAQEFGLDILRQLPNAVEEVWRTQALPLLATVWNWAADLWTTYAVPWIHELVNKALSIFGAEWEARKPNIEQEFQREKEQLEQGLEERIPEEGRTLWEYIKKFLGDDAEK